MINFKAIGQRIKRIRKEKNLTQEKLAELLDVSTEHLSRIETGSYRPSLALIEKISEIFETDEQTLMFGNKKYGKIMNCQRKSNACRITKNKQYHL